MKTYFLIALLFLLCQCFSVGSFGSYSIGAGVIIADVLNDSQEIKSLKNTLGYKEDLTDAEKKIFLSKSRFDRRV